MRRDVREVVTVVAMVAVLGCAGRPDKKVSEPTDPELVPDKSMLLLGADCDHGDQEACNILEALTDAATLCDGDDADGCALMMQILDAFAEVEIALDGNACLSGCVEQCVTKCGQIEDMQGTCSEHCLGVCDSDCK